MTDAIRDLDGIRCRKERTIIGEEMTLEKSRQVVRRGGGGREGEYRTSEEQMVVANCSPSQMNEVELLHTKAGLRSMGVILAWIGIAVNE